ncbi:MAG TPA: kelch repeat-containing protein [Nitrososphaeraceae archaeon]|nr:kelch repeat-containing protein [Nitrososphaeraceae archaeon]
MLISIFTGGTAILFLLSILYVLPLSNAQTSTSKSFWTIGAPMPTARSEIVGALLDDKIYIIGGFGESGRSTSTVEIYDPMTNEWSTAPPLPQPLDHTAAASFDGRLYVVGGGYLNRDQLSNKLFIYDLNTNKWTEGANLPSPRGASSANFINGTLYVVGGVDILQTLTSNIAYDPKSNTWTEKEPMKTAREHLTSAVIKGKLYVIGGGRQPGGSGSNLNEIFHVPL